MKWDFAGNMGGGKVMKKTNDMTRVAVMTAITCVLAPLSIPIGPVPISLTNLAIYFGLYILGTKKEIISYFVYMLIGVVGVPVFSGFTGGPAKVIGPTGGYIIGFIPMALIAGIIIDRFYNKAVICIVGMIAGTIVCYALGTIWLAYQTQMDLKAALFAGVIPFIPGDIIKILVAAYLGKQIRKRVKQMQE